MSIDIKNSEKFKEMCITCKHSEYCLGAYKKDHWCGNHTNRLGEDYEKRNSKNRRRVLQ